jgi:2-oxoglutarate ferredoxin oxidoreductase subunit beta
MSAMIRAIVRLGLEKNDVCVVSGIGCTGRLPTYVDFNTLHTTHGRALAFATGVKLANPRLTVITAMGDGDALAIGGNHFIHSCRRNIDMTAIVVNNSIYGMTGGQYSPTTPHGKRGTTAPYGNVEQAFDVAGVAAAAGATFVARTSTYHARQLDKLIEKAIAHRGFSVVEVITNCHTSYGRLNKFPSPVEMIAWQRDNAVTLETAKTMTEEELEGKFTRGVIVDRDAPEFIAAYDELAESLKKKAVEKS